MGVVQLAADDLRDLCDALGSGVALLDENSGVLYANSRLRDLAGAGPEPAGLSLVEAYPTLRADIDWEHAARNAIARGRTVRLRHHDAGARKLNLDLAPVVLGQDERKAALLTVTDVTDAVRLEARLLRQARTQAIANFGDSVAHEIRNPLNSIHMNVQLLREALQGEALDRARIDRSAVTVQREIRRLDRVVRDFVQYSRPPALQLVPGSVNQVVRAALDVLDGQLREKNLRVETDLQSARPVRIDRDRLQRAIYNVLLNAVQVLEPGGTITCRSRDEERRCLVEIADDGPGLDVAASGHIFDLFYTTKKGGTGLGLPIANRIVEEHGGRMAVASVPQRGATFALFLPYEGPPAGREGGPTAVWAVPGGKDS